MSQQNNIHVLIIDSPSPEESAIGLNEGSTLVAHLENAGIEHVYCQAKNREEFRNAVAHRKFQQQHGFQVTQILHLSCHGNRDGISLSEGSFLTWEQLASELRPLHEVCPNGLGVCLTSCFGAYGIKMAEVLSPIQVPFTWLIGTRRPLRVLDVCVAFPVLYNCYLRGDSPKNSIALLQQICSDDEIQMIYGPTTQQIYTSAFWIAFGVWVEGIIFGSASATSELTDRRVALPSINYR
ncbi:MAG: hypothetical protein WDZ51_01730 [Pirellulaceae bacterium]